SRPALTSLGAAAEPYIFECSIARLKSDLITTRAFVWWVFEAASTQIAVRKVGGVFTRIFPLEHIASHVEYARWFPLAFGQASNGNHLPSISRVVVAGSRRARCAIREADTGCICATACAKPLALRWILAIVVAERATTHVSAEPKASPFAIR